MLKKSLIFLLFGVGGLSLGIFSFYFFEKVPSESISQQQFCISVDHYLHEANSYQTVAYNVFRDERYVKWYLSLLPYLTWNEQKHQRVWSDEFLSLSASSQREFLHFPRIDTIYSAYRDTLPESERLGVGDLFSGVCLGSNFDDVVTFVAGNPHLYQSGVSPSQISIAKLDDDFFSYLKQELPKNILDPQEWSLIMYDGILLDDWRKRVKFRSIKEEDFKRYYIAQKIM